jgi:hypothetical protein
MNGMTGAPRHLQLALERLIRFRELHATVRGTLAVETHCPEAVCAGEFASSRRSGVSGNAFRA